MDKQLIALALRQKMCPVHRKTPKVEARLDGFHIECCCERFRQILEEEARKLVEDDIKRQIDHFFK